MSVTVERERQPSGADVVVLTLDDPARRNILTEEMVASLLEATASLSADPSVGAVVVTGAGPAFCGGAPLASLEHASDEARSQPQGEVGPGGDPGSGDATAGDAGSGGAAAALRSIYAAFEAVEAIPAPTVAAVNGPAVGAGLNLALACDVRVAARSARFDSRFLLLGLHPGGGHTFTLSRLVGPQAARAMVLFGEVVDGTAAERIGLAWATVEDEELLEHARRIARRAAAVAPLLSRRAKETFARTSAVATRAEATEVELEAQLWSLAQPELAALLADAARERARRRPGPTGG